MITEEVSEEKLGRPVPLAAPAGSVILMHCITPHSSLPNTSARGRRTLIFEYRATDSHPIFFGDQTVKFEELAAILRGNASRVARFGGPPPVIPTHIGAFKSLYDSQLKAKAALGARSAAAV